MNQVKIFLFVVGLLVLGVVATVIFRGASGGDSLTGKYDTFAQCLTEKGAIFYGAFWCPHCRAQKEMFGSSEKFLPYVECSTLDGRNQVPACSEKDISGYPTWEFADGSRLSGEVPLTQLAEKTGCVLPEGEVAAPAEPGASSSAVE